MNPYVIIGAIVTAIALYFYGHHAGWTDRDKEMQAAIATANEESRSKEQKLNEQINQTATKLSEANNALDQKATALDRAIRAGRVRLPAPSCVQAASSAPAPSGDRDEGPTDAERQTLAAIAALVAEGDRAINQLNACIDAYNKVMETVNGQR